MRPAQPPQMNTLSLTSSYFVWSVRPFLASSLRPFTSPPLCHSERSEESSSSSRHCEGRHPTFAACAETVCRLCHATRVSTSSAVTNLVAPLQTPPRRAGSGLPRDRPGRAPRKVFIIFLSIVNYSLPAIMNCELFFLSLASPKILRLGNTQINLALPSAFRIFGCVLDTHVRQNASKLAFALTYSYLCALLGFGENNYNK